MLPRRYKKNVLEMILTPPLEVTFVRSSRGHFADLRSSTFCETDNTFVSILPPRAIGCRRQSEWLGRVKRDKQNGFRVGLATEAALLRHYCMACYCPWKDILLSTSFRDCDVFHLFYSVYKTCISVRIPIAPAEWYELWNTKPVWDESFVRRSIAHAVAGCVIWQGYNDLWTDDFKTMTFKT
jgi:hypothetical protein